jgi:hypothetical protein
MGSQVVVNKAKRVEMTDVRVVRGGQVVMTGVQEVKGELIKVGEAGEVKIVRGLKVKIGRVRLNNGTLTISESKDVRIFEIINGGLIMVKDSQNIEIADLKANEYNQIIIHRSESVSLTNLFYSSFISLNSLLALTHSYNLSLTNLTFTNLSIP